MISLVLIRYDYQEFADGWAIGNCTVDLTDKIKFLREIAGMLEERYSASKLEWAGYAFLIS